MKKWSAGIACYILHKDISDAEIADRLNVSEKVVFRALEGDVLNK